MLSDELVEEIERRVRDHHKLYDLSVKGEYWEEILAKSIIVTGGQSDWLAERTHTIGKDQICSWGSYENKRISNKSGVYTISSNTLKINGSRSTTYSTLEDKIAYFSDKKEDFYFCLATSTLKKDLNYYLFCFETNILDYKKADWQEHYNDKKELMGWKCTTPIYNAWIKRNMSDQLWTHIKLDVANIKPTCITR
jgi:hypothetical protein